MTNHSTEVRESQLDWLTLTAVTRHKQAWLITTGRQAEQAEQERGGVLRDWCWRGYVGEHCGAVTCGHREDSTILQLSGPIADTLHKTAFAYADHCTRIDLQVTAYDSDPRAAWAAKAYADNHHVDVGDGLPFKRSLITDGDGGSCYYCGSRSSDRFGRVYNKGAESGEARYLGCWRWEVELKGPAAQDVCGMLTISTDPSGTIRGMVHSFFTERGVGLPWPAVGVPIPRSNPVENTDVDRMLRWLNKQVSPTVVRLSEQGYLDQAILALGVAGSVQPADAAVGSQGKGHHADPMPNDSSRWLYPDDQNHR